jgi:DNA transformation protein and related proteins
MGDADLLDLFSAFGPVIIKRMFGGKGIYADGLIIGIDLSDGEILLKADAETGPLFAAAGCRQWVYEGKKSRSTMPYWAPPDSAFDDPEEMAKWARFALDASRRAEAGKAAKAKPPGKKPAKKPAGKAGSKSGKPA